MGKLQEMKRRAEEIKTKLDGFVIKSESAGGDIKIEITGNRHIVSIMLSDAIQHGDRLELQKHLVLALNKAIAAADKVNEDEMKQAASGMLPGL